MAIMEENKEQTASKKEPDTAWKAIHLLAAINRLSLKANSTESKQALIFLMLNDTINVIHYNRATLWTWEGTDLKILGVSASAKYNPLAEFATKLKTIIHKIPDLNSIKIINTSMPEFILPGVPPQPFPSSNCPNILWLPISTDPESKLALCLERWETAEWMEDEIEVMGFLMKNYAAAWKRYSQPSIFQKLLTKPMAWAAVLGLLFFLLIPISMPISAPSEIVAKDPLVVNAPLEGIIKKIDVYPGQLVQKGELLLEYDPQVIQQQYETAKEEVKVTKAELDRAYILGMNNNEYLDQLTTLKYKLARDQAALDLAAKKKDQLKVTAKESGYVEISEPEKWEGNPVSLGEKIMTISDPKHSKVKIWIPEGDNYWIQPEKPIKVILNIAPEKTYSAKINYLSSETTLNDQSIPSFLAEAEWIEGPKNPQLGLKGTATLYGPKVTIFYWLIRRPWTYIRHTIGY